MNDLEKQTTADLNEKLAAARNYGYAQQALMQAIVDDCPVHVVNHGLDVMRVAAAIFEGTNPAATRLEKDLTPGLIEQTAEFLGLYAVVTQTEKLISEWLHTTDRKDVPMIVQHADRALGVAADPRYDLFVVAGQDASTVIAALRDRGYARVIEWAALCQAGDQDRLDEGHADAALAQISDLVACRPGRVWLLWGAGAKCPEAARSALDERLRAAFMNRNTVSGLGDRWTQQFIANIPELVRRGRDLRSLRNAFSGAGAVVVGAGPSLDESAQWIRDLKIRPIIVASYKAVKALMQAGVTPDFIVMLDPKQGAHHISGLDLSGVAAIISEVSVNPSSLGQSDVPLLPYCAGDDTQSLLSALGKVDVPRIQSGGSVLHIALQFVRLIGCHRVSLAGVDFGFPGERLYAAGAGEGDELILAPDRRSYVRRAVDGNGRSGLLVGALANDGRVIATTIELNHYRGWTEQFIRDCRLGSDLEFFNVSRAGARIEGAVHVADLSQHHASALAVNVTAVIERAPSLASVANAASDFVEHLRGKALKLRELSRTCANAVAAARTGRASDVKMYAPVAEQASACPEVSLILARRLQVMDEQALRSTIDVPERLRELTIITGEEAERVATMYWSVAETLGERSSVRVS